MRPMSFNMHPVNMNMQPMSINMRPPRGLTAVGSQVSAVTDSGTARAQQGLKVREQHLSCQQTSHSWCSAWQLQDQAGSR